MINLILFGPPGSGKGTQATLLVKRYGLCHISTGDLFREEIGNNTTLGARAQHYMDRGELVPDEVTIGMLFNKVEKHPEAMGFIFDGFPRTVAQANALEAMLAEKGQKITLLTELDVNDDEVVRRILKRAEASGRSDDASEDIIRNRLKTYRQYTAIVAQHYAKQDKAVRIDGVGSINEVFTRLTTAIDAKIALV